MTDATQRRLVEFYDRWADLYVVLARYTPGIRRYRRRAVDGLGLVSGDHVVDMGCGPGVNLPLLADAVGDPGLVLGLDVAEGMLTRARRHREPPIEVIRADIADPPIAGPVEGVLATFTVTLFEDPEAVVEEGWELLTPGGRIALLNFGPAGGPFGRFVNRGLELGLMASTPTRDRYDDPLVAVLRDRVDRAHVALTRRADHIEYRDSGDGLVRLAIGHRRVA